MRPVVALLLLLLTGCPQPRTVTVALAHLENRQTDFHGSDVRTRGLLRSHDAPRHYWIEDDGVHRVAIVGELELEALVGRQIEVHGRFSYSRERGRSIDVIELHALR